MCPHCSAPSASVSSQIGHSLRKKILLGGGGVCLGVHVGGLKANEKAVRLVSWRACSSEIMSSTRTRLRSAISLRCSAASPPRGPSRQPTSSSSSVLPKKEARNEKDSRSKASMCGCIQGHALPPYLRNTDGAPFGLRSPETNNHGSDQLDGKRRPKASPPPQ